MSFVLTPEKVTLNIWLSIGASCLSAVMCLFVLGAALWVYSKPNARHILDRVSFRLFLWSMVFEVLYDIAYIAVDVESVYKNVSEPVCATGVYFMMATLGVVNYLCTCIAVNLMLIVCFKTNPLAKGLERWYVGVSVVLGMGIPVIPGALGHFGWDPILDVCWIKAGDDKTRMKYFILDLYLWQTISCVVATVAVAMTLTTLIRQRKRSATSALATAKVRPDQSSDIEDAGMPGTILCQLETQFLKIACLISLYPIALIVVNGIITVGDLYISAKGGVKSEAVYGLYVVYYLLYGGRGIVFAILGIFVDPCLRQGMKAAWTNKADPYNNVGRLAHPLDKQSLLEILGAPTPALGYDNQLMSVEDLNDSLNTPDERPRMGSKSSIDMSAALSHLPMEVSSRNVTPSRPPKQSTDFTRSFSGVPAAHLPFGLTDEVDIKRGGPTRAIPFQDWTGIVEEEETSLEPLDPDLPDEKEERRRQRKAAQVDKEEAIRVFEETKAQL